MRILVTIVNLALFTSISFAAKLDFTNVKLTESAKVSIITCGAGNELYSLFGHSAIRVKDVENHIDLVFNYGTFEFSTPNFFSKFTKGELDYYLSYYPYSYFEPTYVEENRWVKEQVLSLNKEQVNTVFQALIFNGQAEHRYYRYDFFFDNCATRVRDIIAKSIPQVKFVQDSTFSNVTFRDEMNTYLTHSCWTKFGLNLLLGRHCDDGVNNWSSMYLPNNLKVQFSKATIDHNESGNSGIFLAPSCVQRVESHPEDLSWGIFSPIVLILSLISLGIFITFFSANVMLSRIYDTVLWLALSLLGTVVFFLTFLSSHLICRENLNLLLLSPIYLIFLYPERALFGKKVHLIMSYTIFTLLTIFLFCGSFGIQEFSLESYLLVLLILMRIAVKIPLLNSFYKKRASI